MDDRSQIPPRPRRSVNGAPRASQQDPRYIPPIGSSQRQQARPNPNGQQTRSAGQQARPISQQARPGTQQARPAGQPSNRGVSPSPRRANAGAAYPAQGQARSPYGASSNAYPGNASPNANTNAYAQSNTRAQRSSYAQNNAYAQHGANGQRNAYAQRGANGQRMANGQRGAYGQRAANGNSMIGGMVPAQTASDYRRGSGGYKSKKSGGLVIIGIIVAVILVALIAIASCTSCNGCSMCAPAANDAAVTETQNDAAQGDQASDADKDQAEKEKADESATQAAATTTAAGTIGTKLEGAEETTDKNGIVHGTSKDGVRYVLYGRGVTTDNPDKVTLAAVGDQIATDNSLPIADRYKGGSGDGKYDFAPFYKNVKKFINQHDLRYINQETVMATDGHKSRVSGYPTFNSPDNMAATISKVGFNMVSFCSNHLYDVGEYGIKKSQKIWKKYPKIAVAGSYSSSKDRSTVRLIERNGMTFAFLAYTYGDNTYMKSSTMPNQYYLAVFNKKKMKKEIANAKKVADVVIVAMHWGSEYQNEPNEQQYDYAKFLADQGVDLVLGSHAHCTQPTRYVTGESGNKIPVVFGLSDFVSGWTLTDTILSGIFTCDFVRSNNKIKVKNLKWYPCIEWANGGSNVTVRRLCDMTKSEINSNSRTDDVSNDYAYIKKSLKNMGFDIPVKMTKK